ncbi:MAG TPA: class I SAM-dependent methyltransferase [Candidatus Dormibacteraeota bacterium]
MEGHSGQELQSAHYGDQDFATRYHRHYSDPTSEEYRRRFINGPLTEGIDLAGREVLEVMCGSGSTVGYLLSKGANVSGLDISPVLMETFKQSWPGCRAICASIFQTGLPDASYDCVVAVGGLHHIQPDLQPAIDEIHRVLKPGGFFCFSEPHAGSFPDLVRQQWYRVDHMFERNEEAIDLPALMRANAERFEFIKTRYAGNIAYLLVYNSLVFRLPLSWKRVYAPPLLAAEAAINPLLGRRLSCFIVAQWRKKPLGSGQQ